MNEFINENERKAPCICLIQKTISGGGYGGPGGPGMGMSRGGYGSGFGGPAGRNAGPPGSNFHSQTGFLTLNATFIPLSN